MAVTGGFCPLPARLGGDALSGLAASQHARLVADQVAKKRTAPLCVFSWSIVPFQTPVITSYIGMNGAGVDFAPDDNFYLGGLAGFRFSAGRFIDAYGVAYPILPRHAVVSLQSATYGRPVCLLLPNGVEFHIYDAAGNALNSNASGTCTLW